ncbi:MAG TPA: hypothetical protein VGJ40_05160, partial [Gaiellaceae bacterium]
MEFDDEDRPLSESNARARGKIAGTAAPAPSVSKTVSKSSAPCATRESEVRGNPPFTAGFSMERTGIEPVTSGLQS